METNSTLQSGSEAVCGQGRGFEMTFCKKLKMGWTHWEWTVQVYTLYTCTHWTQFTHCTVCTVQLVRQWVCAHGRGFEIIIYNSLTES